VDLARLFAFIEEGDEVIKERIMSNGNYFCENNYLY
jgi:hypothetical protein